MNDENYDIKFDNQSQKRQLTLDQPVVKTLKRDIYNIIIKLRYAMIPSLRQTGKKQLLHWDLWGPFLLSLLLSTTLAIRTHQSASTVITSVFVIMWLGSFIVFLNAHFLGSNMSFFQSVCLLGYCLFPLNIVSIITCLIGNMIPAFVKLILVIISFIWSTMSSVAFIQQMIPERKRKLAIYPIFLFYLFLSWFVLII